MTTATITVDASGPMELLDSASGRVGDLSTPIALILDSALSDAKLDVEASKGGLFGATWPPMSPFTANPPELLQRLGIMEPRNPGSLLVKTGELAASLERGGPNNIFEASATEGMAGTSDPKASLLQEGTSRVFNVLQFFASGGKIRSFHEPGMPERPFLFWHEERFEEYGRILSEHIFADAA